MATFDELTGNGTSNVVPWTGRGPATWYLTGGIGGGTVQLEVSFDGGTTWEDVTGASQTAIGQVAIDINGPCSYRQTLSGATGPTLSGGVR